ncbi:MAG TPA: 4-alpha-glucanotransferase [Mariprofundaceae bacterium]|nr:4-alpha-glucanotransferase [Mariprofundaceae bacterium]
MSSWIDRRRAAVLLHISSLPGPFRQGVLGPEALAFIDDIRSGGFSVWQFLPLGPTHGHGSPYESLSSFAGNPDFIDLRECVSEGWLPAARLQADTDGPEAHADLRREASRGFWLQAERDRQLAADVEAFRQGHAWWLDDFSLFSALKAVLHDQPWWSWPKPLRDRQPRALAHARSEHAPLIRQCVFEQMLFERQWKRLKAHAEDRDVLLFGDLPIYVAHDSADVWSRREFFTVNKLGLCDEVAGVPPDYFSETGQRWGNPLYRWDRMEADGFDWWVHRIRTRLERMHLLRIDHFRGLESFWAIPGESQDGMVGTWRRAPGDALLQTLNDRLGGLPLIAEDLGIITPEVNALREHFGLPGMKILQFAFDGNPGNPYLPAHHVPDSVVYTGTHDNDTTVGWFTSIPPETRAYTLDVLSAKERDMPWAMTEAALASPSKLAVIPMQDLLGLGSEARMNLPGSLDGNWIWRMQASPEALSRVWHKARGLNRQYRRS